MYRVVGFLIGLIILVIVIKVRKIPFKEALALNKPRIKDVFSYTGLFVIWLIVTEFIFWQFGLLDTGQWKAYSFQHIIIRGISICIVAPFSEELIFRGLLFTRVRDRFGLKAALILPAIFFALLHLKLEEGGITILFVSITFIDAIYYSYTRYKTNSVFVPMILHALGNIVALTERLC